MRVQYLAGLVVLLLAASESQAQHLHPDGEWCGIEGVATSEGFGVEQEMAASISDGPDSRVLLVFVRFQDDTFPKTGGWDNYIDKAQLPSYATEFLAPDLASISQMPNSLSAYFYQQSRPNAQSSPAFRVTGDVLPTNASGNPIAYVTDHPNTSYHSGSGGYARLTEEVLDHLVNVEGIDLADYDVNADGYLDHLFLYIRSEVKQNTVSYYSGCSTLDANGCGAIGTHLSDPRTSPLQYWSPSRGANVTVDWYHSGSHQFVRDPGNVVHLPAMVRLLAHEWGHELWNDYFGHIQNVSDNVVPGNAPYATSYPRDGYSFILMQSSHYGEARTDNLMSPLERVLKGWLAPQALSSANAGQTVTVRDLYTTSDAYTVVTPAGTLYLTNRQRVGAFDVLQTQPDQPAPYDDVYNGLFDEGLLVQFSTDNWRKIDTLPADNTLDGSVWFAGDPSPAEGDLFGPDSESQLTPWTIPNINGCNGYATDPLCDGSFVPSWQALDDIRYTGGANGEMAFTYHHDYRTASEVVIRADSWMGQETATSSGGSSYTFTGPVRLTNGSQLRVWENATIVFAGGLIVEDGSELICENGSTCVVGGEALATGASSCILAEDGSTVRITGTFRTRSGGFYRVEDGATLEVAANAAIVAEATSGAVVLEPGAVHKLGAGADLTYQAEFDVAGTAASPLRFERLTPTEKWGEVRIEGDGSWLQYVEFDGGTTNILVAADNVTLEEMTSRNGDYNLKTHYEADFSLASGLRIEDSIVEDATYYGLYLYFTSVVVRNTTVRGSGYHNINVYVATLSGFGGNTVENGTDAGIAVQDQGSLTFGYVSPGPGAHNRIRDNAGHEVAIYSGGTAYLGGDAYIPSKPGSQHAPDGAACNAITSTGGYAGSKLIYNASGQAVSAMFNWWGTTFPSSSSFYGSVDRAYSQSADPTAGGACQASVGPGEALQAAGKDSEHLPGPGGAPAGLSVAEVAAMTERMDVVLGTLSQAKGDVRDLLADLYGVARADAGDATGLRARNAAALSTVAEPLLTGEPVHRASAEFAALALIRLRLAQDMAADARALFDHYAPAIGALEYRRSLLALESALLTVEGRPGEALDRLVAFDEAEVAHARVTPGYEPADLGPVREILARAAGRSPSTEAVSLPEGTTVLTVADDWVTGLAAPSPNPARSEVAVTLTMAEAGQAEVVVFDITGRKVATLATGARAQGAHRLTIDGTGLVPGVYLVRATVVGSTGTSSFARRFTLIR